LPSSALGVGNFALESSFGKHGAGDGEFGSPQNAAVQQSTGDLFVGDLGNHRIQVFEPDGKYVTQIAGAEVPGGFEEVVGVAIDNSTGGPSAGDVYVADRANDEGERRGVIDKFKSRGPSPSEGYEYLCHVTGTGEGGGCVKEGGTSIGTFTEADSVSVDASGNLYVAQYEGPVEEFDPEGSYVATLGPTIYSAYGIAVNASGSAIYIATFSGTLIKLTVEPALHLVASEVMLINEGGAQAVTVDQAMGDVFVDLGPGGVREYEEEAADAAGGVPLEEFGGGEIGTSHGIAYSAYGNGKLYVTQINPTNEVHIFAPEVAGSRAEVACTAAEEVGASVAKLACAIEPKGEPAKWAFEYREVTAAAWTKTSGGTATGIEPIELARETIVGLKPEAGYVYRIVAANANGTMTSAPVKFVTLPPVPGLTKCGASGVTGEGAILEASLKPTLGDLPVKYSFEYGVGLLTEHETPLTPLVEAGEATVKAEVSGLEPNATYKCRLVASDSEGIGYGTSGTFNTLKVRPLVMGQPPTASQVTRKTAVLSGTINPENSGATKYHFVYVADAYYDVAAGNPYHAGTSTPEANGGEGFGDEGVSSPQITGLQAGTTYHYALVASNEAGVATTASSGDYTFTTAARTPPQVGMAEVNEVTPTNATISAAVNPRGLQTSYEVDLVAEIGSQPIYNGVKYGQVAPGYETITVHLEGLAPGTTYHYRIVATNEDTAPEEVEKGVGPGFGPRETFTTPAIASPLTQPSAAPLLATPAIAFPQESSGVTPKAEVIQPTRAQKLAKALKACKARPKKRRVACMKRARRRFGPKGKTAGRGSGMGSGGLGI
jgi:hypothetical protein